MDGWRGPSPETRGQDLFWGFRVQLKKMTPKVVKGRVWGELRNPAYGGTFDLFSGNQVYEQGRSAEKSALKYIRQLKFMYT